MDKIKTNEEIDQYFRNMEDSAWEGKYIRKHIDNDADCPYLLPCGLCSKTNKKCPLHWPPAFEPIYDSKEK